MTKRIMSATTRHEFFGKKIYIKTDKKRNPRREETHGWYSFDLIKDGMSYQEYIENGGRLNDLNWCIEKGHVEVK